MILSKDKRKNKDEKNSVIKMIKQPKPNFDLRFEIFVKEWSFCNKQDKPPEKVRKKTVVEW